MIDGAFVENFDAGAFDKAHLDETFFEFVARHATRGIALVVARGVVEGALGVDVRLLGAQAADRRIAEVERAAVEPCKLDNNGKAEPRARFGLVEPPAAPRPERA